MAYVLAGGRGSRLMELTDRRAKPAVYFGGKSRIIDFALSNALNSGIRRIAVATQYKAHSLIRHLQRGWNFLRPVRNESFDILPASQRVSEDVVLGTADAVYQNIDIIDSYGPKYIVMLAGDHVYKMDYELMLHQHVAQGADVTVGCLEVPREEATGFGVMHVDDQDRIIALRREAGGSAGDARQARLRAGEHGHLRVRHGVPDRAAAARRRRPALGHDFGKDIIPYLVSNGKAVAHRFTRSCVRSEAETGSYWRDVGTIDAYWDANIDLTDSGPGARSLRPRLADLDLRRDHAAGQVRARRRRPARHGDFVARVRRLHRLRLADPPLAFVHRRQGELLRADRARGDPAQRRRRARGTAQERRGRRGVQIPDGLVVGEDPELDATRFRRTEKGICLITQPMIDRLS